MAKDYQPKKNAYILPHNLYMRTLYLIRDYERLKNEYHDIIDETPLPAPGHSGVGDPTAAKAIRIENVWRECRAVEQALVTIPEEYRTGITNNIVYRIPYPDYAHRKTWSRHRSLFVYSVAKNMGWI